MNRVELEESEDKRDEEEAPGDRCEVSSTLKYFSFSQGQEDLP